MEFIWKKQPVVGPWMGGFWWPYTYLKREKIFFPSEALFRENRGEIRSTWQERPLVETVSTLFRHTDRFSSFRHTVSTHWLSTLTVFLLLTVKLRWQQLQNMAILSLGGWKETVTLALICFFFSVQFERAFGHWKRSSTPTKVTRKMGHILVHLSIKEKLYASKPCLPYWRSWSRKKLSTLRAG